MKPIFLVYWSIFHYSSLNFTSAIKIRSFPRGIIQDEFLSTSKIQHFIFKMFIFYYMYLQGVLIVVKWLYKRLESIFWTYQIFCTLENVKNDLKTFFSVYFKFFLVGFEVIKSLWEYAPKVKDVPTYFRIIHTMFCSN